MSSFSSSCTSLAAGSPESRQATGISGGSATSDGSSRHIPAVFEPLAGSERRRGMLAFGSICLSQNTKRHVISMLQTDRAGSTLTQEAPMLQEIRFVLLGRGLHDEPPDLVARNEGSTYKNFSRDAEFDPKMI